MNIIPLRKSYDRLDPFERAVAHLDALLAENEEMLIALKPPHMWDALHSERWADSMYITGFLALVYSLLAERVRWACLAGYARHKDKGPDYAEQADSYLDESIEMRQKAINWLKALQALDEIEGLRCLSAVMPFADNYINQMLGRDEEQGEPTEADCSKEYAALREAWGLLTHSCSR